jgi:hypothetical protein
MSHTNSAVFSSVKLSSLKRQEEKKKKPVFQSPVLKRCQDNGKITDGLLILDLLSLAASVAATTSNL